jgi:hypothetical protein
MHLAEYQQRFQAALLDPIGTAADAELGITARPLRHTAEESASHHGHECSRHRIAIHHRHFWTRMHDFVAFRHPLVMRLLGETEFTELVRRYIVAHPPVSFTVSEVARSLASFLAVEAPWADQPILGHLAAFDFVRSGVKMSAEEATVCAEDLAALAPASLVKLAFRLKRRAALATTRFKLAPARIKELPRDAKLDAEPTYWLIHATKRGCFAQEVDQRTYAAFEHLARGVTIAELFARLKPLGFGTDDIDVLFDRCLRESLLVAVPEDP